MTVWRQPEGPSHEARPTLFLDRDGVVIEDRHYLRDPDEVVLVPGAGAALARARAAGFVLLGVSNQSGLGRGMFGADDLAAVMTRLDEILADAGASFDAFYYCPHAPEDGCACRKPLSGLLDEASERFTWDPARSWVVGDKADDVGLALGAGLGAVLVRTGHGGAQEDAVLARWPDASRLRVADDLPAAIDLILGGGSP